MSADQAQPKSQPKSSWVNLAVDYGPLLVFFLAYRHFSPDKSSDAGVGAVVAITKSTVVFMIATVAALIASKWRLGKVSPMLWLSTTLILGFGTLTVFLGDPFWIQIKPTVIYLLFAAGLFIGLARGKAVLRMLLQSAFDGLDETGWRKLSRNWAWFFLFLAVLNEVLRHTLTFDGWLTAKLWGVSALSFLFTFAQIPMLLRHGLGSEQGVEEAETNTPHD
ncbi:intracellular septation protein [Novosphingobium capsulatum]|uniref:Inner membrane-spanning protein YciB n=1 Tax=Novosphingobium capsulatum TaxID=13688 RepID=A0ABU1MNA2_9SPHN|nr:MULTISPECIES: inner membrane-spanning protein YciB [Novosphingobium]MBB3360309.1 intracellular septation protein [Novosphingobium sp. BK256]MBB3376582.1 intracellular septation protein [Novosphingobium sp. BK280]MBB3380995.1 intracellular septation protein [Novosphingobium sp. BK258]MBB3422646.1 intracellular septation protein [Novosphingobium sp. BK267]MBB3451355.1 intracellular septation protein [Novosphingobium sp. BK352]